MDIGAPTQDKMGGIKGVFGKIKAKFDELVKRTKKIGDDDPRRIIHSIKVGLALTFVSLFYYSRPLYESFGSSGIWAVLTVVVIFEFTVGATLSKGLNRGLATTLGGCLGTGAKYLAGLSGEKEEAILLGCFVFLLAGASTFSRFFPHIKKRYDYGVLIFILTFSLVAISGFRVDKIVDLAHERLSTIVIGGAICIILSIFICPVWAGQDLHNLVANNIEKLSSFLEGFGGVYFKSSEDGVSDDASSNEKPILHAYKSVLNSKPTEESLANFAWWEPGHGRFRFRHPWKQYLKIGVLVRECAYQLEALNGNIKSPLQAPSEFQRTIQGPCTKISSESGKALKELASAMKKMTHPSAVDTHVQNCKTAIDELKAALEASSVEKMDLLEIIPDIAIASTLIDITKCVETIAQSISELSHQARFKMSVKSTVTPEKPHLLHRGTVEPVRDGDGDGDHVVIKVEGNEEASKGGQKIGV